MLILFFREVKIIGFRKKNNPDAVVESHVREKYRKEGTRLR